MESGKYSVSANIMTLLIESRQNSARMYNDSYLFTGVNMQRLPWHSVCLIPNKYYVCVISCKIICIDFNGDPFNAKKIKMSPKLALATHLGQQQNCNYCLTCLQPL